MLHPTPPQHLCDPQGRPYFLWDVDLTLQQLRMLLADPDEDVRAYWMGKVLRQAKPDDALTLMDIEHVRAMYPRLRGRLGRVEEMWAWLVEHWPSHGQ